MIFSRKHPTQLNLGPALILASAPLLVGSVLGFSWVYNTALARLSAERITMHFFKYTPWYLIATEVVMIAIWAGLRMYMRWANDLDKDEYVNEDLRELEGQVKRLKAELKDADFVRRLTTVERRLGAEPRATPAPRAAAPAPAPTPAPRKRAKKGSASEPDTSEGWLERLAADEDDSV